MKPILNKSHSIRFRGILSGFIYTVIHYVPCGKVEKDATCMEFPCPHCEVHVGYTSPGEEFECTFSAYVIEKWEIVEP